MGLYKWPDGANIEAIIEMIKEMVKELMFGLMEENILVNGK